MNKRLIIILSIAIVIMLVVLGIVLTRKHYVKVNPDNNAKQVACHPK